MPSWLATLLGGDLIKTIASFIPNPEEKQKATLALQTALVTAAIDADKEQREINKVEAASGSLFVAGWRPATGWLCVFTLAYTWIVAPFATWLLIVCGNPDIAALPKLDNQEAQTLLYALLGIGAMRTVDRALPQGVTKAISGIFKR